MNHLSAKRQINLIDYGVLSLIFFGYFTFLSLQMYFSASDAQPPSAASFTDYQNIFAMVSELVLLSIAGLYLWWRKFDSTLLDFSVNWYTPSIILLLILLGGGILDLCIYGSYWLKYGINPLDYLATWHSNPSADPLAHINIWLVLFALLNGFFEELFFMGITFAVDDKYRLIAIIASVVIRFGFHVYQGLLSAFGIALMGIAFIWLRSRFSSLVPFALVHSIFDIFGTGIIFWLSMFYLSL